MDIIKDNFNKKTVCHYCNSTFSYNEKDLKNLYFSDELYERTTTFLTKSHNYTKNRTFFERQGQYVTCPLCSNIIVVRNPAVFGRGEE